VRLLDFLGGLPRPSVYPADLQIALAAPGCEPARDLRLWEDAAGGIVGFALAHGHAVAFEARRGAGAELGSRILEWGARRVGALTAATGDAPSCFAAAREDDAERVALLERSGFVAGDIGEALLERSLDVPVAEPAVPPGFVLRALASDADLAAYVAAHREVFWLDALTTEQRARLMRMPEFTPELDLIVTAPDGAVAAFALGWHAPGRTVGHIEPVGTRPAFQRLGLARAAMLEMFRRFRARGARLAVGRTSDVNSDALALYASIGIVQTGSLRTYVRQAGPRSL
jgi:ribosomal protein S18 acetylase RimI-like enzyme